MEQAEHILQMTPRLHHLEDAQAESKNPGARVKKGNSYGKMDIDKNDPFFNF